MSEQLLEDVIKNVAAKMLDYFVLLLVNVVKIILVVAEIVTENVQIK